MLHADYFQISLPSLLTGDPAFVLLSVYELSAFALLFGCAVVLLCIYLEQKRPCCAGLTGDGGDVRS